MPSSFMEEQSQSENATSMEIEGSIGGQHVKDEEANIAGKNSTDFIWFLGQSVKNRACCPLQGLPIQNEEKVLLLEKYLSASITHVDVEDWKFLVNLWSEATYKDKSNKAKTSRGKRSMPSYSGTKSYARLRNQMEEKTRNKPSRLEFFIEFRKRKKGIEVDPLTQDVLKNGYIRAYGPGKSITSIFGATSSKVELLQKLEQTIKESNERVDEAKMEAIKQVKQVKMESNEKCEQIRKNMEDQMDEMNKKREDKFQQLMDANGNQSKE
ncbi:hypothetical protein PTKIN_Ptkin01aG0254300 [Pterospermum kingtungense]